MEIKSLKIIKGAAIPMKRKHVVHELTFGGAEEGGAEGERRGGLICTMSGSGRRILNNALEMASRTVWRR